MDRRIAALTFLALLMTMPAVADVIYDNGPMPDQATSSDFAVPNPLADDFQLQNGAVTITDIHWWGVYDTQGARAGADNFTIRIFAEDSGAPGDNPIHEITGLTGNRTVTGDSTLGFGLAGLALRMRREA